MSSSDLVIIDQKFVYINNLKGSTLSLVTDAESPPAHQEYRKRRQDSEEKENTPDLDVSGILSKRAKITEGTIILP